MIEVENAVTVNWSEPACDRTSNGPLLYVRSTPPIAYVNPEKIQYNVELQYGTGPRIRVNIDDLICAIGNAAPK